MSVGAKARPFRLPILQGLLPLDLSRLPVDAIAGATLAALAIPEVMGYTRLAGTPVVTGLYTLLLPLAFKRLKTSLGLHRLVARDPVMARSWLLSHLILALIIEDATGEVLDSPPLYAPLATTGRFRCGVCKALCGPL